MVAGFRVPVSRSFAPSRPIDLALRGSSDEIEKRYTKVSSKIGLDVLSGQPPIRAFLFSKFEKKNRACSLFNRVVISSYSSQMIH